jgi:large subunit ribosomal protein L5
MYEFLDRLISLAIPRVRDFRGLNKDAFDQYGNYSLGISEQSIFPEVNLDEMEFTQGLEVTITIKNGSPEASRELLRLFGMPFKS